MFLAGLNIRRSGSIAVERFLQPSQTSLTMMVDPAIWFYPPWLCWSCWCTRSAPAHTARNSTLPSLLIGACVWGIGSKWRRTQRMSGRSSETTSGQGITSPCPFPSVILEVHVSASACMTLTLYVAGGGGSLREPELHCVCRKRYKKADGPMVHCDTCHIWYHFSCVKLARNAVLPDKWTCPTCVGLTAPNCAPPPCPAPRPAPRPAPPTPASPAPAVPFMCSTPVPAASQTVWVLFRDNHPEADSKPNPGPNPKPKPKPKPKPNPNPNLEPNPKPNSKPNPNSNPKPNPNCNPKSWP